jgi:hypothetical protein
MYEFTDLFADGFNDLWMAVTYPADGPARKHIQYLIAVGIIEIATLSFDDNPWQPAVVGNNIFVEYFNCFLCCHNFQSQSLTISVPIPSVV